MMFFYILLHLNMLFGSNNSLIVDSMIRHDISPFQRYHTTYTVNDSNMLINQDPAKLFQDIVVDEKITAFFIFSRDNILAIQNNEPVFFFAARTVATNRKEKNKFRESLQKKYKSDLCQVDYAQHYNFQASDVTITLDNSNNKTRYEFCCKGKENTQSVKYDRITVNKIIFEEEAIKNTEKDINDLSSNPDQTNTKTNSVKYLKIVVILFLLSFVLRKIIICF